MADYDSDSSGNGEDIETNVLLGYASKEPTGDDFSQLGGQPTWLDGQTAPSGVHGRCKVCNGAMSLLLQLNGDLPDRFPGHERRLYVFGCRRRPCRRKAGSLRALRAIRTNNSETEPAQKAEKTNGTTTAKQQDLNLGQALFGAQSPTPAQANPFSTAASGSSSKNPFAPSKPGAEQPSKPDQPQQITELSESFAQKARISSNSQPSMQDSIATPLIPWSSGPTPYPSYHLDADKEYLYPSSESMDMPSNARVEADGESSSAAEEKALFESSMDKTFQRFADRLSQNPEQVLRYEFAGQPLLYSKSDAVGKLLSPTSEGMVRTSTARNETRAGQMLNAPRCTSCGAPRLFEMQLTPHAITELEAEETGIEGMDWGTIIVGACSEDCQEKGKSVGDVGYLEEWVGVQWEEAVDHKPQ